VLAEAACGLGHALLLRARFCDRSGLGRLVSRPDRITLGKLSVTATCASLCGTRHGWNGMASP